MPVASRTENTALPVQPSVPITFIQQELLALRQPLGSSPLQEIRDRQLTQAGVRLLIKRDDLIHPCFGGNKWRKLKYHIDAMRSDGLKTLLTFGGAWSNHIYATAGAGKYFGFNTIGVIRGEPGPKPSATLEFAKACGMQLHFINRKEYRKHATAASESGLPHISHAKTDIPYIVPEGGRGALAVHGCIDIVKEIGQPFDIICCSCGTGTSLAGIVAGLARSEHHRAARAIGFSALKIPEPDKTSSPLANDILTLIKEYDSAERSMEKNQPHRCQWHIDNDYHFGGYASVNDELIAFIRQFHDRHGIMLDAVYTGKMLYGLYRKIESGEFKRGTTIVAVHSGGLQGNRGFKL
jgi:1-aminocyclopropane-1-carboxylate deaminase